MVDPTFDSAFQHQLATQSWALYGVGMFMVLLRTFARWRRVRSASLLAPDDWLMMTVVPALYTTLIVCLNLIASGGGSNLYPPDSFDTFTEEDIRERIKGSKIVVISEQAMLNVIWSIKACMLFMYARISTGTHTMKWVKILAVYVAVGWIAVEIAFFTACRPFKGYWGMPPPDPQCTTLEHYAQIQAVFNLTSDFCMLLIPLPMLVSLSLPLKQKLVLGVVFSMGIFVVRHHPPSVAIVYSHYFGRLTNTKKMIAAILTKIYNLADVYSTVYMLWYTREASVAIYVANMPGIWPLLREHIKFLRSNASYPASRSALPQYGNLSSAPRSTNRKSMHHKLTSTTNNRSGHGLTIDEIPLEPTRSGSFSKSGSRSMTAGSDQDTGEREGRFGRKLESLGIRKGSPESDERALKENDGEVGGGWGQIALGVHIDKTIEVRRTSLDGSVREGDSSNDVGRQRARWEIETQAPKVRIEGPDGEVGGNQ